MWYCSDLLFTLLIGSDWTNYVSKQPNDWLVFIKNLKGHIVIDLWTCGTASLRHIVWVPWLSVNLMSLIFICNKFKICVMVTMIILHTDKFKWKLCSNQISQCSSSLGTKDTSVYLNHCFWIFQCSCCYPRRVKESDLLDHSPLLYRDQTEGDNLPSAEVATAVRASNHEVVVVMLISLYVKVIWWM